MVKKHRLLLLYIAAIIICIIFIYVIPSVENILERTYIAEPGTIVRSYDVDGFVVRDETVYVSDKAGSINRLIDSGQLVKGGSRVVEITGKGKDEPGVDLETALRSLGKSKKIAPEGISSNAGYISYAIDGAEGKLGPDSLDKYDSATYKKYASASLCKLDSRKCSKGEPIFKTTRNGEWWIVFFVDANMAKQYEEGSSVDIEVNDETADAYVKSISKVKGKSEYRVVLKCNVFLKGYLKMRKAKVTITTESAKGLIIEKSSIVTKDKKQGVLVKNKLGENVFKSIYVKANNGEKCAVCQDYYMDEKGNFVETIKVYDEILASPSDNQVKESK